MGIRQLARELNLSIGTVSRALNDRPDVNPDTRARVKAAAEAMNYVPDQSGRSLRMGETGMVAAVIPSSGYSSPTTNAIFFDIMDSFRNSMIRQNIEVIILIRGPEEDALTNLKRIITRRIVDGVVISQTTANDPRIPWLREAGMSFVTFGRSAGHEDYDWVDYDIGSAARQAVDIMLEAGHRRLSLMISDHDFNYFDIFLAEAAKRAAECGLSGDAVQVLRVSVSEPDASVQQHMSGAGAGTAILTINDGIAASCYRAGTALGRPVGDKAALICLMPSRYDMGLSPGLSFFDADNFLVGQTLARHFLQDTSVSRRPLAGLIPMSFRSGGSHLTSGS